VSFPEAVAPSTPVLGHGEAVRRVRSFPSWPAAVLAAPILVRAAIFAVALVAQPWASDPNRIIPAWAQILQAALFAALAFVLVFYGRGDRRAWALGLFVLDAAATLLMPFVRAIDDPTPIVWLGLHLRTDAFQAALVWFFASVFPRASERPALARTFTWSTTAAFVAGAVLVVFDTYAQASAGAASHPMLALARALERNSASDGDWYFTLQFLLLAPLLVAMPLKLRELGPNDRRRFMWLMLGLTIGFLPLVVDAMLVTLWPDTFGRRQAPYLRIRGALILLALTAVPVAGAYAALVQRTLDVRLVFRAALQYVFARWFIRAVAATPFIVLAVLVAQNRSLSLTELVTGPPALALAALAVAGVAAAAGRKRLLGALDVRFFRQEVDARATLVAVAGAVRQSASLDDFRDTLTAAIDNAFHPHRIVTAVAGADDYLHALDADAPPLPRASALSQVLGGSDLPLDVEQSSTALILRLGAQDRQWLDAVGGTLVVPLRGSTNALLGVIALGEKRSELPYTDEDKQLLVAVGSACGLALDRILTAVREASSGDLENVAPRAARECVECGLLSDGDTLACACGGLLQRAPVPLMLDDRLRFLQRIGMGGMGVVYRATDLRLQQLRAVKTLPGTQAVTVSRIRREARAMAAATHQNLATLHGMETWRGAPMLVMEYLEGGTLADRLKAGPLSLAETLTIGAAVGNALVVLHGAGILHRDIKPSNIGFTAGGIPKLLDFGLAKLAAVMPGSALGGVDDSTWSLSLSTGHQAIRGTPAYLSPWVLTGELPSTRDDCWSLAVTLLEACTGANPFRATTAAASIARVIVDVHRVSDAAARLPIEGRRLFADLLGSHDRRPNNARDLVARLQQCALEET
jgi:GAF domain-containing protein